MLISLVSFLFVFMAVALAHEIGHFVWAKRAGIRVLELGVGFGPTIYSFTRDKTKYSLNIIPFLAFVRLAGIDDESGDDKDIPVSEKYESKSPFQKFSSIVAGPLSNIFLAFVVFSALSMTAGLPRLSGEVLDVADGSPAQLAGLQKGDVITGINGGVFPDVVFIIEKIHKSPGKQVLLNVKRGERAVVINAVPKYDKKLKSGLLGFSLKQTYMKSGFVGGLLSGAEKTWSLIVTTLYVLSQLIAGRVSLLDLAGPVGIAQFSGQAASHGFASLVFFLGFISVNLGVVNLLPLPALDGGRIVFIIIESIRKKPVDIHLENKIHSWGLSILLFLMVIISFNDILRIFYSRLTR